MENLTEEDVNRAFSSFETYDCDDSGVNDIARLGFFEERLWFFTKCVSQGSELEGQYFIIPVLKDFDSERFGLDQLFHYNWEGSIPMGRNPSPNEVFDRIVNLEKYKICGEIHDM